MGILLEMIYITKESLKNDPLRSIIKQSIHRVIKQCIGCVKYLEDRSWNHLLKLLCSLIVGIPYNKPFKVPQEPRTIERYADWWTQLIIFYWKLSESLGSGAESESASESGSESEMEMENGETKPWKFKSSGLIERQK
jgi:hypothetical protein